MVKESDATSRVPRVAAIIPAFRIRDQVLGVIERIGTEVEAIYVVDDACPEGSGQFVTNNCEDRRVRVIQRALNGGVGAAVKSGYIAALADGHDIVVKIDGDGQMDPRLVPRLISPIIYGQADYAKGNRFFNPEDVRAMPKARLLGNAALSFMTKVSSGYWDVFDPTNGFTAIDTRVLRQLPLEKVANRYFFESDMLFRLGTLRAAVADVPMTAIYGDQRSGLHILRILGPFIAGHTRALVKRIVYNYFLRAFSIASLELVLGLVLLSFGIFVGTVAWSESAGRGIPASSGSVMLAALPILVGIQLLLSFLQYDIQATPTRPIGPLLAAAGGWLPRRLTAPDRAHRGLRHPPDSGSASAPPTLEDTGRMT